MGNESHGIAHSEIANVEDCDPEKPAEELMRSFVDDYARKSHQSN
jgi:hypothetical protein